MARNRGAASLVRSREADYTEVETWYRHQIKTTTPPTDRRWQPTLIGPTWRHNQTGWLLPERTLGWAFLAWCGVWLRHKQGPWVFTPEQARFVLWFYSLDESGRFDYHSGVLQRNKGWGKDPLAATLSLGACFAPITFDHWDGERPVGRDESDAWVRIIAVSQEQTKNTMKLFPGLVTPEAIRHYGIQVGKLNVYGLGDTRQIEAVTSSPLRLEGGRPTLQIRNETQNWNASNGGHDMAGVLEGDAAKSAGAVARMLDICNAYRPGEDSVAERVREAWNATQGADATTRDFGLLYDSVEAPPAAPLTADEAPDVVRSVAGDAAWLDMDRILKSILNPANPPSESRRKWYNQIVATEESWIVPAEWDALAAPQEVASGTQIVAFFDGSKSDDATAIVGCRLSDGYLFQVGVWQRPPRTDTWLVDRASVDQRVAEMFEKFGVVGFWADISDARDDDTGERYWDTLVDEWVRRYGDRLDLPAVADGDRAHKIVWDMRWPAHQAKFVPAAERFVTDVGEGNLRHDGAARLAEHVKNARRRPNKFGVSLGKEHRESARKVDAAVCAVGARMMWRTWLTRKTKTRDGRWWG